MLIVPFIYDLDASKGNEFNSLSIFHFYLEMCIKNNYPIVAHQRYFDESKKFLSDKNYMNYLKNGLSVNLNDDYNFSGEYSISSEFDYDLVSDYPSQFACWIDIVKNNNDKLLALVRELFDKIESDYNDKIAAVLCFYCTESLRTVAAERGIKVIFNEQTSFRPPLYIQSGYFDFEKAYSKGELEKRYKKFLIENSNNKNSYFTRKEILSLFLTSYGLNFLDNIDNAKIEKQLGVCVPEINSVTASDGFFTPGEIKIDIERFYSENEYRFRSRNDEENTIEFILSCKRIASVHSNMSFDAMLLGRTSCSYGESPFSFMANSGIADKKENIAPIEFINFVTFAYFVPWQLVRNPDYIFWRLTNPTEIEIYTKHLDYYIKNRGLNKKLLKIESDKRLKYILSKQNIKKEDLRKKSFVFHDNIYSTNAFDRDGCRIINPEGFSFGPYWKVPEGKYEVTIRGKNLKNLFFSVYYLGGKERLNVVSDLSNSKIILKFNLDKRVKDLEIFLKNESISKVELYSLELEGEEPK